MKSKPSVMFWTDDEREVRAVEEVLAKHGSDVQVNRVSEPDHALECLRNARVALGFHQRTRPIIVFIDLDGEGPGALNLVREMKRDPLLRRLPVLVYADDPDDDAVTAAYESGVNAFIERRSDVDFPTLILNALDFWLETAKLAPEPFRPASRTPIASVSEQAGFTYRIFPQHRLGVAVKSGVLHGKQLLDYIKAYFGDPDWSPGFSTLDDYRSVVRVDITTAEAQEIAAVLDGYRPHLEGGRIAIIVDMWMHQIAGEMLIAMGRLDRDRVRIFRSLSEALNWLHVPAQVVRPLIPK